MLPNKKMGGDGLVYPTRNDAVYPGASDDFDLDALIEEATAESVNSPNSTVPTTTYLSTCTYHTVSSLISDHSTSAKKRALVSYV